MDPRGTDAPATPGEAAGDAAATWAERVDAQRALPEWGVGMLAVVWPSFLAACAMELLVFAFVDPHDIVWSGESLAPSRQAVYSVAFFAFWLVSAAACWLAAFLRCVSRKPAD